MIGPHLDVCAVSRKVDRRLKIFVGVEQRAGWTSNLKINCFAYFSFIFDAYGSIAEAIVHEFCVVNLELSQSDAAIAELLVSSKEELELPSRMKHQLESSSSQELAEILNRRDENLLRYLCLDTNCDLEWDRLPTDVRIMFVKRVASEHYEMSESQLRWIESNRCDQKRIDYQAYLARRDLHACATLSIDEYAAALLRDPAQKVIPVRREIRNDIIDEADRDMAPSDIRSGCLKFFLKPFVRVRTSLRSFIKFFFLAFVAEPEYHRELAYTLNGSVLKKPITFIATSFWRYSWMVQNFLLPFFLVRSISIVLICSSINVPTCKTSRNS